MNTYISTGAFKTRDISEILNIAAKNDIKRIEISPGLAYNRDIKEILFENRERYDFLVHNYFPTPQVPFALNLASNDSGIIEKSMNMCREAIDFVSLMGISYYSVHCGFCFDTDGKALGKKSQVELPRIPYDRAKKNFVENVRQLCSYGMSKGTKIAIENNVMAEFAQGDKELYLGVDTRDMKELLELIDMPNIGTLIDFAHAQVSDSFLHFDVENMVKELYDSIIEIHISDNDGRLDENKAVAQDSAMLRYLKFSPDVPITLEAYNLTENEIKEQIKLIENVSFTKR